MRYLLILLFPFTLSAQQQSGYVFGATGNTTFAWLNPTSFPVSTATQTRIADTASALRTAINGKQPSGSYLVAADIAGKVNNTITVNGQPLSGNVNTVLAQVNATAQTANIATTTLYAVPATGFYRVSIYITVTSIGTTSTMPSTTITYTDGNSGTNVHSTVTTATATTNSLTTTFAQATYVCYAKTGTNIQYATGSYASTGTAMQYALRIRLEAL
jgi:hypothetical protein